MTASLIASIQRTKQIFNHLHHAMATSSPTAPPWRSAFLQHVEDMDAPNFVLSTLHPVDAPDSKPQYTPRCRTVVFRGMWACLPVNPKNQAELNPSIYESDLPTITTDARMDKIPELFRSAPEPQSQSGRGGPIEAVFWMPKVMTQWRLRGHAYIIGPDIDTDDAAPVRAALNRYMRRTGKNGDWGWGRELTAQFGNLSPLMRGTFRNPPPGTPLSIRSEGCSLGQKVMDLEDELARTNFRVVVIVPEEVDQVDLSDPERARRWNYEHVGSENVALWKVQEKWP